jgi:hypothetical protein
MYVYIMDKDFEQTSFIPKKTVVEKETVRASRPVGLISVIAWIIFFVALAAAGGSYLFRANLEDSLVQKEASLQTAYEQFQPSLIKDFQELDKRLKAASSILKKHVATSPVFAILEDITLPSVRYTGFDYVIKNELTTPEVEIQMQGEASGFNSIAVQSDIFNEYRDIKNPIFSDFSLDAEGDVSFDLTFSVDPAIVLYDTLFNRLSENILPTDESNSLTLN